MSGGLILTAILLKTFTASMMASTRRLEIQELNLEEQVLEVHQELLHHQVLDQDLLHLQEDQGLKHQDHHQQQEPNYEQNLSTCKCCYGRLKLFVF